MHNNNTSKLLLTAALLLLTACATSTGDQEDATPAAIVDPLEGFRLGRVGHAAKTWFILPEDDNARLCLTGDRAAPFQHLGTRVKFDAEVGAPPDDPKACTPIQLKRIAEVPEGDLRPRHPALRDSDSPPTDAPLDDK